MTTIPNFALRAAKHVQRRMIVAALSRLEVFGKIDSYLYVGLGSRAFGDFRLFHKQFGIRSMISVEADPVEYERAKFNQPYACIDIRHDQASAVLATLDWSKPAIIWLDMCDRLDRTMLEDLRIVASNAPNGSTILMTVKVKADPSVDPEGSERIERLRNRVGDDLVGPEYDTNRKLGTNQLAQLSWRLITETITESSEVREDTEYHQVFHFRYRDSVEMLTVGGVLCSAEELAACGFFGGFPFCRDGAEPYKVEVPELTVKEMRRLDQALPCDPTGLRSDQAEPVPIEDARKYAEAYRYFPVYVDAEIV